MVTRWLSKVFRTLLEIIAPSEEEEVQDALPSERLQVVRPLHEQQWEVIQQPEPNMGQRPSWRFEDNMRPNQGVAAHSRRLKVQSFDNEELFNNEFRREAKEHSQLKNEYFKMADEARSDDDYTAANRYVQKVSFKFTFSTSNLMSP